MFYLFLFSLVLFLATGWQIEEEMEERESQGHEQKEQDQSLGEPISVVMHYGMKLQDDLDLYIRSDGILLCSQRIQYRIERKDIVEIAVHSSKKEKTSFIAVKEWFYDSQDVSSYYIVIGYKNAANKLKVLTLRTDHLPAQVQDKLDQLK